MSKSLVPPQDKWLEKGTLVWGGINGIGIVLECQVRQDYNSQERLYYKIHWIEPEKEYYQYNHEQVVNMMLQMKKIARAK